MHTPERRHDAVLFDLDGTLADTLDDLAGSMNRALVAAGHAPHPPAAYRAFVGEGVARLAERVLPPDATADAREALVVAFKRDYDAHLLDSTRLYDGVADLLDALVARGLGLAVLSNKPDGPTRRICEALLGAWPFEHVLGQRPEVPRKPDPTAAFELAEALGVAPSRCAFVGDTAVDILTARAARMTPIGVTWGFRGPDELTQAGARLLVTHPRELAAVL